MNLLKDFTFLIIYKVLLKVRLYYGPFLDLFTRLLKLDFLKFLTDSAYMKYTINVTFKFLNNFEFKPSFAFAIFNFSFRFTFCTSRNNT